MSLKVRTVPLDHDGPLLDLAPTPDAAAWLLGDDGLVAWGAAARFETAGPDRFARTDAAFHRLAEDAEVVDDVRVPGTGLVALGSFAFADDAPGSVLVVPRVVVGRRGGDRWLTTIDPPDAAPAAGPAARAAPSVRRDRPRFAGSSKPDLHWLDAVAAAIERIAAGGVDKVVLARDHAVWSREPFDALDLARRLAVRFPDCHTFVVEGLVGASPELLAARSGRTVRSRALAGTTGRGSDELEDAALGDALLASDKDQREHAFAVASVRDVLERLCDRLDHDQGPRLLRIDTVQHLATSFEGRLAEPRRVLEVVDALHPTAAVGGTPRAAALTAIRELEGMDRERYAGPVGWTDAAGDGEWAIALRCAQLAGARARLFAGVGIVAGSLPEEELEETRLKLLAMQAALGADPEH